MPANANPNTNDATGILDGLPRGTSEYQYQGIDHFLHTIHLERDLLDSDSDKMGPRRRSEFIIISNIPEDIFLKDIHSSTEKLLSRSFTSYDPVRQILLAKMTTGVHEQASLGIAVTFEG